MEASWRPLRPYWGALGPSDAFGGRLRGLGLDRLTGQREDPGKETKAAFMVRDVPPDIVPDTCVDLLGVRLDLAGNSPARKAPRTERRVQGMKDKLVRAELVANAADLPAARRTLFALACVGSMRWGASWVDFLDQDLQSVSSAVERVLIGRRFHSWRHRGAAWALTDKR